GGKGGDAPAARDTAGGGLMEVWLTPQQIAAMRLAGMPTTDRGVRSMAKKNLLANRTRVRGKGIEISLDSLPIEAQRDYWARQAARMNGGESDAVLLHGRVGPAGGGGGADGQR